MTIPDYQTLMLPVLRLANEGEIRVPDAADRIATQFKLTPKQRDQLLPSGRQRILHNRVHWAKFYMTKAGLIESPRRGWFKITPAGRAVLSKNPNRIDVKQLLKNPAFAKFYKPYASNQATDTSLPLSAVPEGGITTPEEQMESAHAALNVTLEDDLIQQILQNTPIFFEKLILKLLIAMNYGGSRRDAAIWLGKPKDEGVDGMISADRLGLDRVYVQAKRYVTSTVIGSPAIREFVGSLKGQRATKGVFVTTSSFTADAKKYAKSVNESVVLIDGHYLAQLMIEHDVGVRTIRTLEIKRLDEDFFTEDD